MKTNYSNKRYNFTTGMHTGMNNFKIMNLKRE